MPGTHQPRRERGRDNRRQPVGERIGQGRSEYQSPKTKECARYWSFHNLGDIFLFKMKAMLYILWYAPGWEDVTAQYIGGDALSCYRSVPSGERGRGDREAAGCTLGQCITLAYKMAARWTEGS